MKTLKPKFITFTGIDDRTDLSRADKLSSTYPIEWGVLISETSKDARFPCSQAIHEIMTISGSKSAHLCGKTAKEFQAGIMPKFLELSQFDRIQVNGHKIVTHEFRRLRQKLAVQIVTQSRHRVFLAKDEQQLFDLSGGQGILPEFIPEILPDRLVGYAGGMGPETVLSYLSQIKGTGEFWIDMEGRIRSDGWFDLDKVEQVCHLVWGR